MEIRGEVEGAQLGDRRLAARLVSLAATFARAPGLSYPKAAGDEATLEATYRFLNNGAVTPEGILAPHFAATRERCSRAGLAVVCHDTTEFRFSTEREGLGRISQGDHGFLGHFALAVDVGTRAPLGVLGLKTLFREGVPPKRRKKPTEERESTRWLALVEEVEGRIGEQGPAVIHVMDREADGYELFTELVARQRRFVVRLQFDRMVETASGRAGVRESTARCETLLSRSVALSERRSRPRDPPSRAKKHPMRSARVAHLSVSAQAVDFERPSHLRSGPETVRVNVVLVRELDPPGDVERVEWALITTEPVETAEQAAAVVDCYRLRWSIEEYFKALKTGCAYEKRQLESRHALLNALAIFTSVAWLLLALRTLARDERDLPADQVLSPLKLRVLQGHRRTRLRPGATIREAMLAIAALGGHLKNNGEPGWIVLGRGMEDLLLLEQGAAIALGCDQS